MRDTPETLIVGATPWVIGLAMILFILLFATITVTSLMAGDWMGLLALCGVVVGLAVFAMLVRRTQVIFHRPEGWVEMRSRTVFGTTVIRHSLAEISQAVVERSTTDGTTTFRVALVIPSGQSIGSHPLSPVYSNSSNHYDLAEAINHWLSQARRSGLKPQATRP